MANENMYAYREALLPIIWDRGGNPVPLDIMGRSHINFLREFIKGNKLKPVNLQMNMAAPKSMKKLISKELPGGLLRYKKSIFRYPWPGGIIGPHFHFDGDIYIMEEAQWQDYTRGMKELVVNKLSKINDIQFELGSILPDVLQAMEVKMNQVKEVKVGR